MLLTAGCTGGGDSMAEAETDGGTTGSVGSSSEGGETGFESSSESGETDTDSEPPGERVPFDAEGVPESTDVFPRTPMAGLMEADSFVVSGHVATGELVTLRVWQPAEVDGEVYLVAEETLTPDEYGFVKTRVAALEGGQWYAWGLFSGDAEDGFAARSLLCRVRTALAEGQLEPVSAVIAACVGRGILPEYVDPEDLQPVEVWDSMVQAASLDYDAFIHLGDQGYLDNVWDAGGTHQQYLDAWGAYHGGGYRAVYPNSGLYFTWDDHEVTNNGTVELWTDVPEDRERIDAAQRAYYRVMPIDAEAPAERPLWGSYQWGDTVEFIVLDCRSERQAPETGVYVSDAQFQFLLERLRDSPCRFKCVVNSVPFSRLNLPPDVPLIEQLVDPDDRWEGYQTQRDALKAFVDEHALTGIVWVTGDVHMCYVGQIEGEPSTRADSMWEVCVTSGNTNPLANQLPEEQFPWRSSNPHVPRLTFEPAADPADDRVVVEFIDTAGQVAHRRELSLG